MLTVPSSVVTVATTRPSAGCPDSVEARADIPGWRTQRSSTVTSRSIIVSRADTSVNPSVNRDGGAGRFGGRLADNQRSGEIRQVLLPPQPGRFTRPGVAAAARAG